MLAVGNRVGIKTKVVVRVHSRWGRQTKQVQMWKVKESDVTEHLGFVNQMIREGTSVFEAFG